MAQLDFKYGAMGAGKTAGALITRFSYEERGLRALLVKPRGDTRDGDHLAVSRAGLSYPCLYFDELRRLPEETLRESACVIVDEAQFLSREDVLYLVRLVDELDIPVVCYGLRTDFRGELFPGSATLLGLADRLEEVESVCWCGRKAVCTARLDERGEVLREGEQVLLGGSGRYVSLCRRHWTAGDLGPGPERERHAL